jgi:predicted double-glycine peptidase
MTTGAPRSLRWSRRAWQLALCLPPILCFGGAARAGSVYLSGVGIGGTVATVGVESFQEQKFRTTIAQQHDFSCGSAALATLLTYNYGVRVTEREVFDDMIEHGDQEVISHSGFSLLDIKNYLARRGLESNGYKAPLEKLLEVRLPAIVLLNVRGYRHFVVLEGIDNGMVLLSDPANGMRTEPVGVFEKEWSGIFFLITSNVERAQAGFNSPSKWATAPPAPMALTRYALDLATLSQPGLINLMGF